MKPGTASRQRAAHPAGVSSASRLYGKRVMLRALTADELASLLDAKQVAAILRITTRGVAKRVERGKLKEWKYYPVGMVVGQMKEENTVRQVIHDMLNEFLEATENLGALVNGD